MNEEIKEIDIKKDLYLCSPLLNKECTKENCYINNGCCCHTVNEKYSQEHLLNYITNLQKENENLKEENKRIFSRVNDDELLISNAMNYAELQDYKTRNEKAVEKLGKYKHYTTPTEEQNSENEDIVDSAYNILQGGDEN